MPCKRSVAPPYCVSRWGLSIVQFMVESHLDGLRQPDVFGWLPLHHAARRRARGRSCCNSYLSGDQKESIKRTTMGFFICTLRVRETLAFIRLLVDIANHTVLQTTMDGRTPLRLAFSTNKSGDRYRAHLACVHSLFSRTIETSPRIWHS
jgi:hypothetical protein